MAEPEYWREATRITRGDAAEGVEDGLTNASEAAYFYHLSLQSTSKQAKLSQ